MRTSRLSGLAIAALAVFTLAASDFALARGGGGGGGRGGGARRGGGGRSGTGGGIGGSKSSKDKNKKDLEAARERLRQADYRGRDAGRDRGAA